ncbi:MAG: hypothetical protein PUB34_00415 [Clostridia bacterium]|nr:hypothetical protein [Clostridia bacterium]
MSKRSHRNTDESPEKQENSSLEKIINTDGIEEASLPERDGSSEVSKEDVAVSVFEDALGNAGYRQPSYKKRKKIILTVAIAVLSLIFVAICTFVAFKLFGGKDYDRTDEFYFSSDFLTAQGASIAQNGKISFELYNYQDDLRTSIYDIEAFDIKVSADGKDITDKCKISESKTKLNKNKKESSKITIDLPDEYFRKDVDVTVKSEPNAVTLKGTFTVTPLWSWKLTGEQGSITATLTLSNDKAGSYTVKWDGEALTADSTNRFISASEDDDKCTVTLEDGESCEIVFFKKDVKAEYFGFGGELPVSVERNSGGDDK